MHVNKDEKLETYFMLTRAFNKFELINNHVH